MFALQASASCKGPGFEGCCPQVSAASPEVFGPPLWFSLHTMAATYPEDPSPAKARACENLFGALPEMLPCEDCGQHFRAFIEKADLSEACRGGRRPLARLLCEAHNKVNERNGKEILPCNEATLRRYETSALCPPLTPPDAERQGPDIETLVRSLRAVVAEGSQRAGAEGVCRASACSAE